MSSIFKKWVTRPMPKGAEIIENRKGRKVAKWKGRDGRARKADIREQNGVQRIREQAGCYIAKYRDASGHIVEKSTGCRDKEAARAVLNQWAARAEKVRAGIITTEENQITDFQTIAVSQHIADYVSHLRQRDVNKDRVKTTETRLIQSAEACGFNRLCDLNADKLEQFLSRTITSQGKSVSVYNGFIEVWLAFGHWLAGKRITGNRSRLNGEKRIASNPFQGIGKHDSELDRRRVARALTEDQLKDLLEAATARPLHDKRLIRRGKRKGELAANVSPDTRLKLERLGWERSLIYKMLYLCALRVNELRTLRLRNVTLDGTPHIKLEVANEKNRKGNVLALRQDLADDLSRWLEVNQITEPDSLVFNVPTGLLRILNRDLAFAGISKKVGDETFHLHAFRHTCCTHLHMNDVDMRTAQEVLRHSDPRLTAKTYTDPKLLRTGEAVEKLPRLTLSEKAETGSVAPTVAPNTDGACESMTTSETSQPFVDSGSLPEPAEKSTFHRVNSVGATRFERATSASRTIRHNIDSPLFSSVIRDTGSLVALGVAPDSGALDVALLGKLLLERLSTTQKSKLVAILQEEEANA